MHSLPLSAETLFNLGPLAITNSIVATWLLMAVVIGLGLVVRRAIARGTLQGFGGSFIILFESILGILEDILGWEALKKLLPLLGTFFIFILFGNWMGLLPGFGSIYVTNTHYESVPLLRAATTDLNTTLALAILSVLAIQLWGLHQQRHVYLAKFVNFSGPFYLKPINFFVGLLEIISELAKVLSFSFRLFGNIFAGEVLLSIMFGLVPLLVPSVFYGLELFVGFIQAFVFIMLTSVFLKMAGESHAEDHG